LPDVTERSGALRNSLRVAALKIAGAMMSPAGPRARLTILIYHRVMERSDGPGLRGVSAHDFRWQMELLARCCKPLSLREGVELLREGRLPERAVCVTFDDGYADNETQALPILLHTGVPATFFVASGFLDGGRMFSDAVIESVRAYPGSRLDLREAGLGEHDLSAPQARGAAMLALLKQVKYMPVEQRSRSVESIVSLSGVHLPDNLMMSSEQVVALARAGMCIGGHTVNHPILASIDDDEAEREIRDGRDRLAALTGEPVDLFAYPNGLPGQDYEQRHIAMVRALGFRAAVSTAWGSAGRESKLFELPRFTPWDRQPERFALRLAANWKRTQREFAPAEPGAGSA
jgi:peptidoglycan/xylan/chitin deacetylase (PgdA/CDA1 family)